jgi:hypothetical protein
MTNFHPLRRARGLQIMIPLIAAAFALVVFGACDKKGGGGSSDSDAGPDSGSVAVLLTDGPVEPGEFKHIWVSITEIILIGEPGQVTIFRGRKVVDLRDLEDVSKFATLGRRVPPGVYEKIRLLIEEIELVPMDGSPAIRLSKSPNKLPPKIDLNPRESFRVLRGRLLAIQLDMDAGKSIHIVETGHGNKYQFRPVVFVDILTGPFLGKLVLLEGVVDSVDDEADTFVLCKTHPVSRPTDDGRATSDYGDELGDREDRCVTVVPIFEGDNKTSFFDENGDPTDFEAVDEGDEASVLGRFMLDRGDEALVFEAEVVHLGNPLALDGIAETEVDGDDQFLLLIDEGQPVSPAPLLVQLRPGTKVFTRRGIPLPPSKIMVNDPVRATGILDISGADDLLKAAFIMVDVTAVETDRIRGEISEEPEAGGARLTVMTESDTVCVDVPEAARIFAVELDDGNGLGSAKSIDRSDLRRGDQLSIFGIAPETAGDCFTAETVISFIDAEPTALPSTAFAPSEAVATTYALDFGEEQFDEEVDDSAAAGDVEVYDILPGRHAEGLVWVKLPGDEDEMEAANE